jgi:magnesium chelatase family protein
MFAVSHSSCIVGLDALPVQIELSYRAGEHDFTILGLGGAAVKESRERIILALECSGIDARGEILVNLAPAEIKKESAAFDLPIALALACARGALPQASLRDVAFCGELSLAGDIRSTVGITAHALAAAQRGFSTIVVPHSAASEAAVVRNIRVIGAKTLGEVVQILTGRVPPEFAVPPPSRDPAALGGFVDVLGQEAAKRALTIAAAGGHNLLMIGPPGCGKSMLAERMASLLPPLDGDELLEVLRIHSIAGQPTSKILAGARPFRAPHYVISDAGLVGGGLGPRPGEISLAHRGILFLDEFPEFRRTTVEALRSPLEIGWVQLSRARASTVFPSRFQLIAAMNPCPCGRFGSKSGGCRCSHHAIRDYLAKISQPILDRIDLHVELEAVDVHDLVSARPRVASGVDERPHQVAHVRNRQLQTFGKLVSEVSDSVIRESIEVTDGAKLLLSEAIKRIGMSARGYVRVLRVARTIADLEERSRIDEEIVAEAISYRTLDRLTNLLHSGRTMSVQGLGGVPS